MSWTALLGTVREYAIFTLDEHGVIDSWNEGVGRLLGFEEHEYVGQDCSMFFTPEDRAAGVVEFELATAREAGEAMDDRWHMRKDGSRVWVNGILHAVRDDDGNLTGYLKIMRDQTNKRAAEAQHEQQGDLIDAILASLPGVFYMYDGNRFVRWNDELERVTGYSAEEIAAARSDDLLVEAAWARQHVDTILRTGQISLQGHLRTKDGEEIPYLLTGQEIEIGGVRYILGLGVENREHVEARKLLERRALEQTAIAQLAASRLVTDDVQPTLDLTVRLVAATLSVEHVRVVENRDGGTLTRASHHEHGTGLPADTYPAATYQEDAAAMGTRDLPQASGARLLPSEILGSSKLKGGLRAPIHGQGWTFGYIEALSEHQAEFSAVDLTFLGSVANLLAGALEQNRLHLELERRADTDDLTGLLKRVAFEDRLVDALARAERQGSKVAVLFLDLDRFKEVNDSLGHKAGDEVLRHVARRLREAVRSWDVVARHGGDEFVLFLPDIEADTEIEHVTTRLLEVFDAPFTVAGRELKIGATIGIASYPDQGQSAEALLNAADSALYRGKAKGRNTYHVYAPEDNEPGGEPGS